MALSCLFGVHAGARGTKVYQGGDLNTKRYKNTKIQKHETWKNTCFQKCVILHSFKQNGLQIQNQRKNLHMVARGENTVRRYFEILRTMLDFESYIVENSSKWSVSDFGSVKKRFFIAKSCLEHIPKHILLGRSMANFLKFWRRISTLFQKWLETVPKDAPWCADYFPYWMTAPSALFGK